MIGIALGQSGSSTKDATKDATKDTKDTASASVAEVKTQNYKGTLVDASCAMSGGSAQSGASQPAGSTADSAKPKAQPSEANRSASDNKDSQSCSLSANTSQFAVKLDDGRVVKLDDVGSERAAEELKANKHWAEASSGGKPIHVKVTGMMTGDVLTALSIH
jgi:hypothetical protein